MNFAASLGPVLVILVMEGRDVSEWRVFMQLCGFSCIVFGLICLVFLKDRPNDGVEKRSKVFQFLKF